MRLRCLSQVAALAATATLLSCQGAAAPEDPEGSPSPAQVTFGGKADPMFAGNWKSEKGDSTLDLGKDGTLQSETTAQTAGGKSDVKVTGQWLVDGDKLKLRYEDKANNQVVMQYSAKLSGNKLELVIPNSRIKTTYLRK
jgi:hypothetical protein